MPRQKRSIKKWYRRRRLSLPEILETTLKTLLVMMELTDGCMSGLNPPPPSSNEENVGRRLMALVRSTEKSNYGDDTELCDLLMELIILYSRRGLLLGIDEKAHKVLELSSPAAKVRRKRDAPTEITPPSSTDDESLLLPALIRILMPKENSVASIVISLAADVCQAICIHVQDESQTSCAMAEQEILVTSSRSLLTGLGATIQKLLSSSCRTTTQETRALISCLQATKSLISLLAQKVPRSTIAKIDNVSWTGLVDSNAKVRQSSAFLLSVLPLTGANNITPADAWSASIMDCTVALAMVLNAMAPLRSQKTMSKMQSEGIQTIVTDWIHRAAQFENEPERVEAFKSFVQGLSACLVALLTRQAYSDSSRFLMMTAKLAIEPILDLMDSMIAFPSAAETLYFSTKKRLRSEVVHNGLLSSAAAVLEMANLVKYLGHDILDATMATAGSTLFPFARQVIKITHASLFTSASTALQKVLDPNALGPDGKRKRWLHNSAMLRTRAIQTFSAAIQTFGACVMAGSLSNNETRGERDETQAISCIGGSLLEQLSWPKEEDGDWATLPERVNLGSAALNALSTVLITGGGYLSLASRSLIDSIALTCLSSVSAKSSSRVATWPPVKIEILKLGSSCLCTPWPDGAMSSIMSDLRKAAKACTRDRDSVVASEGAACLRLCDALSMPRVPALLIVTNREHCHETQTAASLIENIKSAREDIAKTETLVTAKLSSPSEDSPKNEDKKSKRQKVQAAPGEESTQTASSIRKSANKPVASLVTHEGDAVHSESTQLQEKGVTGIARENSNGADPSAPASEECVLDTTVSKMDSAKAMLKSVPNAEEKYDMQDSNIASQQPWNRAQGSLKKGNSDDDSDDDFLPDIVVDGGPDEEDR